MPDPIWTQASGTYFAYNSKGQQTDVGVLTKEGLNLSSDHSSWPRGQGIVNVGGPWGAYEWSKLGGLILPKITVSSTTHAGGQFTIRPSLFELGQDGQTVAALNIITMQNQAAAEGPTLIQRASPTQPAFDAATAVGEVITGGLPAIIGYNSWKDRMKVLRGSKAPKEGVKMSADEFLNWEFGVKPLIRDIMTFSQAVKQSGEIIDQYTKNSGVRQRRRAHLSPIADTSSVSDVTRLMTNWAFPTSTSTFNASNVVGARYKTNLEQIWFSGAFKYYIPDNRVGDFTAKANRLLGVKPDIETLWNLAPWSWAADWFGNTGDCIANLSNLGTDATVMEWGYVMYSKRQTERLSVSTTTKYHGPQSLHVQLTKKYLTRVAGNPFYWSVGPSDISPKQAAILAALGISRF